MYRLPVAQSADPALRAEAFKAAKARVEPGFWRALGFREDLAQRTCLLAINADLHGFFVGEFAEGLSAFEWMDYLLRLEAKFGKRYAHAAFYFWPSAGRDANRQDAQRIFTRLKRGKKN